MTLPSRWGSTDLTLPDLSFLSPMPFIVATDEWFSSTSCILQSMAS